MKTAIVIGATGLVGSFITLNLLDDNRYEKVKVFVRNSLEIKHRKFEEYLVDFDKLDLWKVNLIGDELYSALGTTLKKAGSKEAQYKVDFNYQYEIAKFASQNGVKKYLLVSSMGANYKSGNFYLRMKGKLDESVEQLDFNQVMIFRPSILAGKRSEQRILESFGIKIAGTITKIIPALKKYHPIKAEQVAKAMIMLANQKLPDKIRIYQSEEISKI